MISKIIHYCWFGYGEKNKLIKDCIRSWEKYCPDYEIIEWNENNFDINSAPTFVRQAYSEKKWAFVSDYVRLYALNKFGGIYLDTDMQIIKSLDELLSNEAFMGFLTKESLSAGIIGSVPGFFIFQELSEIYEKRSFYDNDGKINLTTNNTLITWYIKRKYGLEFNNSIQNINGLIIYPLDYFTPDIYMQGGPEKSINTYCIHHFLGSWNPANDNKDPLSVFFIEHSCNPTVQKIRRVYIRLRKNLN